MTEQEIVGVCAGQMETIFFRAQRWHEMLRDAGATTLWFDEWFEGEDGRKFVAYQWETIGQG